MDKNKLGQRTKLNPVVKGPRKIKGSRLGIVVLFLGTIFLSSLFWFKTQANEWWQKINVPAVYRISKGSKKELSKLLGIKPDLSGLKGLENSINLLTEELNGEYGLYLYYLKQEQFLGIKEDEVFKAASVNKIPIIVSFYQQVEKGKLDEESEYILEKEDIQDYGTGRMRYQNEGSKYLYKDLIKLTGKNSDNTAAFVLAELIGQELQGNLDKLGMENTLMEENTTTPKEMGDYLVKLYQNELVGKEYKEKILAALTETDFEDRIPQGVPEYIQVAHKTGNEVQVYNDCGIILSSNPYVLCILTKEVTEKEALEVIPKISRLIWEFANRQVF